MKWSPQQDAALKAVSAWLADPSAPQIFRLFGFAGTGKTTLARYFAEGVDGTVLFAAYTGKAAYVLRQMGCVGASTLHSLIYHSKDRGRAALKDLEQNLSELRMELLSELSHEDRDDPDVRQAQVEETRRVVELKDMILKEREALSQPMFVLNQESPVKGAALLCIDEVSMVDGKMGEDLCSFGTKILVLGDPAQLPPVMGTGFFTDGVEPDIMLTEIHRQAAENPIIAMATKVRQETPLTLGSYGESLVIEHARINESYAMEADQILVGRNKTRHSSNRRMRQLLGRTEALPVPEDKLVCLRNNHDLGLLNGAIWHVTDIGFNGGDRVYMSIASDVDDQLLDVEAWSHHFLGDVDKLPWWERLEAEEFDYGNALTVHKAQGSQFDNVLLFDESWCFRKDRWKWLYTGLTRAADKITVVRM